MKSKCNCLLPWLPTGVLVSNLHSFFCSSLSFSFIVIYMIIHSYRCMRSVGICQDPASSDAYQTRSPWTTSSGTRIAPRRKHGASQEPMARNRAALTMCSWLEHALGWWCRVWATIAFATGKCCWWDPSESSREALASTERFDTYLSICLSAICLSVSCFMFHEVFICITVWIWYSMLCCHSTGAFRCCWWTTSMTWLWSCCNPPMYRPSTTYMSLSLSDCNSPIGMGSFTTFPAPEMWRPCWISSPCRLKHRTLWDLSSPFTAVTITSTVVSQASRLQRCRVESRTNIKWGCMYVYRRGELHDAISECLDRFCFRNNCQQCSVTSGVLQKPYINEFVNSTGVGVSKCMCKCK